MDSTLPRSWKIMSAVSPISVAQTSSLRYEWPPFTAAQPLLHERQPALGPSAPSHPASGPRPAPELWGWPLPELRYLVTNSRSRHGFPGPDRISAPPPAAVRPRLHWSCRAGLSVALRIPAVLRAL